MLKKILNFLIIIFVIGQTNYVLSADCTLGTLGYIDGNWAIPGDCSLPTGAHLVNGDITVGNTILTIPNNSMLVIDLSTKKITFNLGKIILQGTGLIKYIWSGFYNPTSNTSCPPGQQAILPGTLSLAPTYLNSSNVGTSGIFYCQ